MDPNATHPVIDLMEAQKNIEQKGGTMRLGAWDCQLDTGLPQKLYGTSLISERHRHRYEFNNSYTETIFDDHFKIAGTNPETNLVEIVTHTQHPWFVGVQFHPEYKSTVSNPHPLFVDFVRAAVEHSKKN